VLTVDEGTGAIFKNHAPNAWAFSGCGTRAYAKRADSPLQRHVRRVIATVRASCRLIRTVWGTVTPAARFPKLLSPGPAFPHGLARVLYGLQNGRFPHQSFASWPKLGYFALLRTAVSFVLWPPAAALPFSFSMVRFEHSARTLHLSGKEELLSDAAPPTEKQQTRAYAG